MVYSNIEKKSGVHIEADMQNCTCERKRRATVADSLARYRDLTDR